MKRLLLINSVCGIGSTGRICTTIAKEYEENGYEVKIGYGRHKKISKDSEKYAVRIGNFFDVLIHAFFTLVFDSHGLESKRATKKFIKWANSFNPDVLWLHNIHGFYINYQILFKWIKSRPQMEVKWTLHDCWAFTGHCSHFTYEKCNLWKTQCNHCLAKRRYPQSYFLDASKKNYLKKRKAFTGVKNLTLITPSEWLADLTRESFLCEYPVQVQNNSVNFEIFKPTDNRVKEELRIGDKKMILGVANPWSSRKGLFDFLTLSKVLSNDFVIVLVGCSKSEINKYSKKIPKKITQNIKEIKMNAESFIREDDIFIKYEGNYIIPQGIEYIVAALAKICYNESENILGDGAELLLLPKTENANKLAEFYSASDFFVNATYEDTFPTVNIEARACGTKVITYKTGGCPETMTMELRKNVK